MARRIKFRENWEMFMDPSFYDMWAVRPKNDKAFDSPRLFHFTHKEDAEKFIELINVSNHAVLSDVKFNEIK
jgi:hypothetical protein